jgi:uncharacterized lipoprotein YehR (DUF1307 family)
MKKLILFLLAAVMVISLAACGNNGNNGNNGGTSQSPNGVDKEFTIYVNSKDDWTPFIGKSGVTFTNSNNDVLDISDNGTKVEFIGKIVGESRITATYDGNESKALVKVRAIETTINYNYNPPTDNYYILYEAQNNGTTYELFDSKIGDTYCFGDEEMDWLWRFTIPSGKGHIASYGGGDWTVSQDDFETEEIGVEPLDAMELFFVHYLRTSDTLNKLADEYYIGKEKILGIDCWVFDSQGFNDIWIKFWIDPSNGCCLKYDEYKDGKTTTVTEYNLNFTEWPEKMKP